MMFATRDVAEIERIECTSHEIERILGEIGTSPFPPQRELTIVNAPGALLPSAQQCRALAEAGVSEIVLRDPVDLHRDGPHGATDAVRFLRDTVPLGMHVSWTPADAGSVPPVLVHLWPPADGRPAGAPPPKLFGIYYWRKGPNFISIQDIRPGIVPCFYLLDEPELFDAFLRLQQPAVRDELPVELHDAFDQLEQENMLFSTGRYAVALPCRVVRWPTPFNAF